MIFKEKPVDRARTSFNWIPTTIGDKTYWLERIYYRTYPSYFEAINYEFITEDEYNFEKENGYIEFNDRHRARNCFRWVKNEKKQMDSK